MLERKQNVPVATITLPRGAIRCCIMTMTYDEGALSHVHGVCATLLSRVDLLACWVWTHIRHVCCPSMREDCLMVLFHLLLKPHATIEKRLHWLKIPLWEVIWTGESAFGSVLTDGDTREGGFMTVKEFVPHHLPHIATFIHWHSMPWPPTIDLGLKKIMASRNMIKLYPLTIELFSMLYGGGNWQWLKIPLSTLS